MNDKKTNYWNNNLKYVGILLSVWFMVSFGFSILLKDYLDSFSFAGFKLGFWFAQQGSMYVFVIIIFIYVYLINSLDRVYKKEKDNEEELNTIMLVIKYLTEKLIINYK